MAGTLVAEPMAKKDASKRDDKAVKIEKDIADKAGFVVSRKGITLAEYLSDILRQAVQKDFAKAIKEMEGES